MKILFSFLLITTSMYAIANESPSYSNESNAQQAQIKISGDGQNQTGWGFEYTSAPTYGVYLVTASQSKLGWYLDIKSSFKSPDDKDKYSFTKDYAINALGDRQTGTQINYTAINVGRVYSMHENISLLAGLGLMNRTEYLTFHDPSGILGTSNTYYLEGESKNSINAVIGTIFYLDKVNIKLMYESFSKSIGFGLGGFF